MTDIQETVRSIVGKQTEIDDTLRALFKKNFGISNPIDPHSTSRQDNPGYRAYAEGAVEAGVALMNMVISIKKPDSGRGFRALSDLTFALNANDFWVKNAPVLVPVLTIVLNSHRDYVDLAMRRQELGDYAVYDKMMSAADGVSLELFAMLLYLLDGPELMATKSLSLKMDLAPYLLS